MQSRHPSARRPAHRLLSWWHDTPAQLRSTQHSVSCAQRVELCTKGRAMRTGREAGLATAARCHPGSGGRRGCSAVRGHLERPGARCSPLPGSRFASVASAARRTSHPGTGPPLPGTTTPWTESATPGRGCRPRAHGHGHRAPGWPLVPGRENAGTRERRGARTNDPGQPFRTVSDRSARWAILGSNQ